MRAPPLDWHQGASFRSNRQRDDSRVMQCEPPLCLSFISKSFFVGRPSPFASSIICTIKRGTWHKNLFWRIRCRAAKTRYRFKRELGSEREGGGCIICLFHPFLPTLLVSYWHVNGFVHNQWAFWPLILWKRVNGMSPSSLRVRERDSPSYPSRMLVMSLVTNAMFSLKPQVRRIAWMSLSKVTKYALTT